MIEMMDTDEEILRREKQKESEPKVSETIRKGGLCLVQELQQAVQRKYYLSIITV
jgi:hypothetical protein